MDKEFTINTNILLEAADKYPEIGKMLWVYEITKADNVSLRQEIEHLKQILWAAVSATGGTLFIPYSIWTGLFRDVDLEIEEDDEHMAIVLHAVEGQNVHI